MRAAQVCSLDGPEGVQVVELPDPVPEPGRALIEVHAAAVGFPDLLLTRGRYQLKPELPFTLGVDFAGVVRSAPAGSELHPGERVAGWQSVGADAELVLADPANVFPLPDGVGFDRGACLPLNYLTAHFALVERGGLKQGETVLVLGAAGGVGSAAVQVAKAFGATVIGSASTDDKRTAVTGLGADVVVGSEGIRDAVTSATGGRGVDIVVDVVGREDLVLDALRSLAIGGRLLVLGFAGGRVPAVALNRLLLNNVDVRGVAWGPYTRAHPGFARAQWDELMPLVRRGSLAPLVGEVRPLDEVAQALRDLEERRTIGKTVLRLR
jgi:NADPH:quinone reductase